MELRGLLTGIDFELKNGTTEVSITGVCLDSRKIEKGNIFIAVKGTQVDGHKFIKDVIKGGASAVVCEDIPVELYDGVTYVKVIDGNAALGKICCNWYGNPSRKFKLVGVTGTNGKTTTATLLYEVMKKFGHKSGLISTVCNYIDDEAVHATHTTPDPYELNGLLSEMADAGCEYVFMEVSSHSIAQKRIEGLYFAGGIFTNITRDHLDYHKTFENYLKAKKSFFDNLPAEAFALSNTDDKNGKVMLQNTKASKYYYSVYGLAAFKAKIIERHFEGMLLNINGKEVFVQFVGKFNVYNILAIYGTLCLLGKSPETVLTIMSILKPVSGRMEFMRAPSGFLSIVDYAHTPDALENVLNTINELIGNGKIITVVGAGGNRDKGKRPLMAKAAANLSSRVILTSDNPRFENPESIIDDMQEGITEENKSKVIRITDRREAIRTACMFATAGDVVLVAGKGHENYQEIKGVKHHFDDKEVLNEIYKLIK